MIERRRKRSCRACHKKFYPDYRQKKHQQHCSAVSCQTTRRSQNVQDWYLKNPDCLRYQRDLTRAWFRERPDYQGVYRNTHPSIVCKNRLDSKTRMRRKRGQILFDKTNSMFSQLLRDKADKCYLNIRSRWVHLRLIKQTRYTRYGVICQNLGIAPKKVRPFRQPMVDLEWILKNLRGS